jgi:simple sugar transport system substrate-binding protein
LSISLLAACGGDDDDSGSSSGSKKSIKVVWEFFGPKNDGGYNVSQWRPAQDKIRKEFGDRVEQVETDNLPYTEELSQVTEQYISTGANLLIDTVAAGELFSDVCAQASDIACVQVNPPGTYPDFKDGLPENVSGVYHEYWNPTYLLGMAAGMLTKTDTIGYVAPYDVTTQNTVMTAYLLGCQRVNPDCKLNRVNVNSYYDPAKTAQATKSLINTGADVIHGWTDDPSFCQAAEEKGVRAMGNFIDYRELCPNAYAGGVLWEWSDYYVDEVRKVLDGSWTAGRMHMAKLGEGSNLAPWGQGVSDEVKDTVKEVYDDIRSGTNVFKGPIYDNKGKLRVKKGEELAPTILFNKLNWVPRGVS